MIYLDKYLDIFLDAPESEWNSSFFQSRVGENKPLNSFRVELPACCRAAIRDAQVLVFPADLLGSV